MENRTSSPSNDRLRNRADRCIAQGALTNSKRPACFVNGVYPTHLKRAQGCYAWDEDNNRYIDFVGANGTSVFGFAYDEVNLAVINQLKLGTLFSLGSNVEVECAEKLKALIPMIDKVRFLKTGTEACMAAVRIARAKTGRNLILSNGYHGHGDEFISLTPPGHGVIFSGYMHQFGFSLDVIDKSVAAVIIEPVMTDASEDRKTWLQALRTKCTETGALLIFDEIITGFRVPKFTITNYWGIQPDLICLGKGMANGMPIAAVGGARGVMDGVEWFVSSTFAGETLSLAAALKTMTLLRNKFQLEYLWERAKEFQADFNRLFEGLVSLEGYGTRAVFRGDETKKALLWQEACRAGILFGASFFFNFSHIAVREQVLNSLKDIATRMRTGQCVLEGDLPTTPFAQKARET